MTGWIDEDRIGQWLTRHWQRRYDLGEKMRYHPIEESAVTNFVLPWAYAVLGFFFCTIAVNVYIRTREDAAPGQVTVVLASVVGATVLGYFLGRWVARRRRRILVQLYQGELAEHYRELTAQVELLGFELLFATDQAEQTQLVGDLEYALRSYDEITRYLSRMSVTAQNPGNNLLGLAVLKRHVQSAEESRQTLLQLHSMTQAAPTFRRVEAEATAQLLEFWQIWNRAQNFLNQMDSQPHHSEVVQELAAAVQKTRHRISIISSQFRRQRLDSGVALRTLRREKIFLSGLLVAATGQFPSRGLPPFGYGDFRGRSADPAWFGDEVAVYPVLLDFDLEAQQLDLQHLQKTLGQRVRITSKWLVWRTRRVLRQECLRQARRVVERIELASVDRAAEVEQPLDNALGRYQSRCYQDTCDLLIQTRRLLEQKPVELSELQLVLRRALAAAQGFDLSTIISQQAEDWSGAWRVFCSVFDPLLVRSVALLRQEESELDKQSRIRLSELIESGLQRPRQLRQEILAGQIDFDYALEELVKLRQEIESLVDATVQNLA